MASELYDDYTFAATTVPEVAYAPAESRSGLVPASTGTWDGAVWNGVAWNGEEPAAAGRTVFASTAALPGADPGRSTGSAAAAVVVAFASAGRVRGVDRERSTGRGR